MLRRRHRILIALLVLIVAAALGMRLVLLSPRVGEMILARASERLGLEISAESCMVRWSGGTVIRAATIKMPLTNDVLLTADRVALAHTAVPLIPFKRAVRVRAVRIDNPRVHLRRYESGRWNVQAAWARLQAGLGSPLGRGHTAALPQITVRDAFLEITEPNGVAETVGPVGFSVRPQEHLVCLFDLDIPSVGDLEGRLVRGNDWAHEIGFAVQGAEPVIRRVLERDDAPITATGQWQGSMVDKTLYGRIQLAEAAVGPAALRGAIDVEASANGVTLRPRGFVLADPNLSGEELRLTAGAIQITREQIAVQQLCAEAGALAAQLDGQWDVDSRAAEFSGSWRAAGPEPNTQYFGAYQGTLKSPRFGQVQGTAVLTARAETEAGNWSVTAEIRGAGPDWQQSQWRLSAPQCAWSRDARAVDLAGVAAELDLNWPQIRLTSLHLPHAEQASGSAEFHAETRRWSADMQAEGLRLDVLGPESLDLRLIGQGDGNRARISQLRVKAGERIATAGGGLSFSERRLEDVTITADWPARRAADGASQVMPPNGHWHVEATANGHMRPLAVEIAGELTGQNVSIGKQTVERVAVPMRGSADAERFRITSEPFSLLGGRWQVAGQHERSSNQTQLSLVVEDMSLQAAAEMAGSPLVSQGRARAHLQLVVPDLDIRRAVATGAWNAEDIHLAAFRAEKAHGKLRVAGGRVRFEEIRLEHGDGRADASMEFALDAPQILSVGFKTTGWPVRLEGRPWTVFADGQADLTVDAAKKTADGRGSLSARVLWNEEDIASLRMLTAVDGQTISVRDLHAETLGGVVEGTATVPLDRWTQSEAKLRWQEVQPALLESWWPPLGRSGGSISGTLVLDQVDPKSRPPGPMQVVLDADIADGHLGPAQLGACYVVGYLDRDRLLVRKANLQAAGGHVNVRGRLSRHLGSYYASLVTDFNELDLDQLVHAFDPNAAQYRGVVSGEINLLSSSERGSLSGEADIRLARSDLADNSVIQILHRALNLQVGKEQPAGTGQVKIRLEGPAMVVQSFEYLNRGIEIRGAGRMSNVKRGAESPVDGYAVASTRILRGIKLPGLRALDNLMTSFQSGVASVKIDGTVEDVEVKIVPLPEIGDSFRRLLWAQLRE